MGAINGILMGVYAVVIDEIMSKKHAEEKKVKKNM